MTTLGATGEGGVGELDSTEDLGESVSLPSSSSPVISSSSPSPSSSSSSSVASGWSLAEWYNDGMERGTERKRWLCGAGGRFKRIGGSGCIKAMGNGFGRTSVIEGDKRMSDTVRVSGRGGFGAGIEGTSAGGAEEEDEDEDGIANGVWGVYGGKTGTGIDCRLAFADEEAGGVGSLD